MAAAWFLLGAGFGVLLLIAILAWLDYIYWSEKP